MCALIAVRPLSFGLPVAAVQKLIFCLGTVVFPFMFLRMELEGVLNFAERNAIRSQSATSTPKRQNSLQERNRKSSLNIFGEPPSGRRSPSNASVVSVPIRRSGTPLDHHEKAYSDRMSQKDQR